MAKKSLRSIGWIAAVAACLLGSSSLAVPQSDLGRLLDSLFVHLPHSSFEWVEGDGVSERAAMRVPVRADGLEGTFQLDTGLDVTLIDGKVSAQRGWETYDSFVHLPSFQIGDVDLGPAWFHSRPGEGKDNRLSGSLGLDLFIGRIVLIDYPGRRLAIMNQGEVPLWMWQRATWTPAQIRHAKLFLNVILGGKNIDGLFFDTGSSAFDIVVDFDTWTGLTGRSGPEDAPIRWEILSWGNKMTAIGATIPEPLVIGSARIEEPRVFYLEEQPDLFASWPFPASGLVGNAPFWERVVLLDLGLRPRFGILRE